MDERALDRAIDAAAGALVAREPSRALGYHVMERVREHAAPARRRLVWVGAAAGIALCAGIAAMFAARPASEAVRLPRATALPVAQAAKVPEAPANDHWRTPEKKPVTVLAGTRVPARAPRPPVDVSPIAPISTEPIVLAAIDVPQLDAETTLVSPITIEPLVIEPLAASND